MPSLVRLATNHPKTTMKPKDRKEFESIEGTQERAKWLLSKGVTSKITINSKTLDVTCIALAAGVILPGGWKSEAEAVAGGTAWLAEKAGLANAVFSDGEKGLLK